MTPVSKVPKRYVAELSGAMLLYVAALFARSPLLVHVDDGAAAKAILLSPILPILLMAVAAYRFYRGVDEYQRLRVLKIFASAAGVTIIVVASWPFMQDAGAPPLSNFAILGLVAISNAVLGILFKGEDVTGLRSSFKQLAWSSVAAAVLSAGYLFVAESQGWPAYPFVMLFLPLTFVLWLGSLVVAGWRAR